MTIIPVESIDHDDDILVIIVGNGELAGMSTHDPVAISLQDCGKHLVNPAILICHESEHPRLESLLRSRDLVAIIAYLQRGNKELSTTTNKKPKPQLVGAL